MTPSHPRPLPEAPLVEAYGARADDGIMEHYYSREHAERHNEPGTVVPLIAADRLTSGPVVEFVARAMASLEPDEDWPSNEALGGNYTGTRDDEYRDGMIEQATDVLAALRTLLEEA